MYFFNLALAVIFFLLGKSVEKTNHHFELANSMNVAVDSGFELPWDGDASKELSIITLGVTAYKESRFNPLVASCVKKGDNGRSITSYQMMKPWALQRYIEVKTHNDKLIYKWVNVYTEKEMCSNQILAAKHALHLIDLRQRKNKYATPAQIFQSYVTGKYSSQVKRVYGRCALWANLANKFGLRDKRKNDELKKVSCFRRPNLIVKDNHTLDKETENIIKSHYE